MEGRTEVDWEALGPEWRAGIKSKSELSREFGVSRAALDKHFGALGIKRDLAPKIRAEAERRLQAEQVTTRLQGQEADIVEVNAEVLAHIRRLQRQDIGHLSQLCRDLAEELGAVSGKPMDLERLIQALGENEDTATLAEQVQRIISLPSRIASLERLASAKRTLTNMECQAWGISDTKQGSGLPAYVSIQF